MTAWCNHAPQITVVTYPEGTYTNSATILTCRALDADGDILTYHWQSDYGIISGKGPTVTWTAPADPGIYSVSVYVDDSHNTPVGCVSVIKVLPHQQELSATNLVINLQPVSSDEELILDRIKVMVASEIAINYLPEKSDNTENVEYVWTADGGKLKGLNLKEKRASGIAWYSPGVPGDYHVRLSVSRGEKVYSRYLVKFTVTVTSGDGCKCH